MREELDGVILRLIEFGILDKLQKDNDFTRPDDGKTLASFQGEASLTVTAKSS